MDDDGPPGVPEWVVTYGDMMSLLLTFFIMLVSMSERKEAGRVRSMLDSLEQAFGSDDVTNAGVPGRSMQTTSSMQVKSSTGLKSEGGVKKSSRDDPGVRGASGSVQRLRKGQRVTIGGPSLFQRFEATPSGDLAGVLDVLADVLASSQRQIAVRGHCSPEPLPRGPDAAAFATHDELAFARAVIVAEGLEARGVAPHRLVISTAGSREPRLRTRNPDEQRLNDRVDVFLVDNYSTDP